MDATTLVLSWMPVDFYRPGGGDGALESGGVAAKAAVAHRRFASNEGDLPTLLNVYRAWWSEAVYVPSFLCRKKRRKRDV